MGAVENAASESTSSEDVDIDLEGKKLIVVDLGEDPATGQIYIVVPMETTMHELY